MKVARTQDRGKDEQDTDARMNGQADDSVEYGLAEGADSSQDISYEVEFTELPPFFSMVQIGDETYLNKSIPW